MSVSFPPAILGLEMAAPILWAPGIVGHFLLESLHAHEILFLGGGILVFLGGIGSAYFNFMGAGIAEFITITERESFEEACCHLARLPDLWST